jgi:DNA-binding MarR family transcriptional regulator
MKEFQLVKKIDDLKYPPLEKHVGARLWRLSEMWKRLFDEEMVALGYPYFAEARSNILRFVGPKGVGQAAIVKRMKLSKQAVQQLIDELASEGVVKRMPDPEDGRSNIIVLTQAGLAALHDANLVKRRIEQKYLKLLGQTKLIQLNEILDELANDLQALETK